jgi:DNA replication and repair protein RecF
MIIDKSGFIKMYITDLHITNYRNYSLQNLTFSPHYNFIIGDNGQGKTNLIEAIYILGMAKSFRISTDKDLVKKGENFFYVKGLYHVNGSDEKDILELGYDKTRKNAKHNGQVQKRLSDFVGNLKTIVFLNQDIELILGSASNRRRYMDMVISLSDKAYLDILQNYNKVLKNRNRYLKEEKTIFNLYDEQLIRYGSELISKRLHFFDDTKDYARSIFSSINPDITDFNLQYKPNLGRNIRDDKPDIDEIKTFYEKALEKNRQRDTVNKTTVTGPHRDDFNIKNGREMFKKFASQGQTRVGALTLKMIAMKHIELASGQKVIMLLDDILLDLDVVKKDLFLELVKDHQCFFTSTDPSGIGSINQAPKSNKIFSVKNGEVYSL